MPKVRDGDPEHQVATVQEWRRGATPRPRTGVAADSYPMSEVWGGGQEEQPRAKELRLCGHRRAKGSYSMFKVRRGGREEIPLIQDKEQWLHFVGAAMKRNPTSKVRETQVGW